MSNSNKSEKVNIPPVGLLNLSRENKNQKNKNLDEISNLYNICYINSSIQCLFHLDEFIYNILNSSGGNLCKATVDLVNNMRFHDKKKNLSASEIKAVMGEIDEKYKENKQEDADEFISNYINALIEETADKSLSKIIKPYDNKDKKCFEKFYNKFYKNKGSSYVLDLFYGILRTQNFCESCNLVYLIKFNAFNILELPIYNLVKKNKKKVLDMKSILNNYTSKYKISNTCEICKNQLYTETKIYTLPQCPIIYFGRKINNYFINNDINISETFDFNDFMSYKETDDSNNNNIYKIKGIIDYTSFGKLGHYSATCLCNNKWYNFDDIYVEEDEKPFLYKKPIILFYGK